VSPLFLLGCAFLVAAVMIGLGLANTVGYVIGGILAVAGIALVARGATRPPKRAIRSHSGAAQREKARAKSRKGKGKGGGARGGKARGGKGRAKR
jgi:hypothetical protein